MAGQYPQPIYAGFWRRLVAAVIDGLLLFPFGLLMVWFYDGNIPQRASVFDTPNPSLRAIVGEWVLAFFPPLAGVLHFVYMWVVIPLTFALFWRFKQATPGEMALSVKVADARTGRVPSMVQCVGRYFAYYLALIPLFLGVLWIAFDKRKQGWHDKLAGTVVIVSPKKSVKVAGKAAKKPAVSPQRMPSNIKRQQPAPVVGQASPVASAGIAKDKGKSMRINVRVGSKEASTQHCTLVVSAGQLLISDENDAGATKIKDGGEWRAVTGTVTITPDTMLMIGANEILARDLLARRSGALALYGEESGVSRTRDSDGGGIRRNPETGEIEVW